MNSKFIIGIVGILLIVFGIVTLNQNPDKTEVAGVHTEALLVGWIGSLTGESNYQGVELAQKFFGGKNMQLIFEESGCDSSEAVSAANRLFNKGVVAIISGVCTSATLAVTSLTEEKQVVLISSAASNPAITSASKYVFQVTPSDIAQGAFAANVVYARGQRRLAILYSDEERNQDFIKSLQTSFLQLGGEIVASEEAKPSSVSLFDKLDKIKSFKPQAIYVVASSPVLAVRILTQMNAHGMKVSVFGSSVFSRDEVVVRAGEAAEGLTIVSINSGTSAFIQNFHNEYETFPMEFAAQGFDAFQALQMAVDQGARTGEEIRIALASISFDGASGDIRFNEQREVPANLDIFLVKEGELEKSL